MASRDRAVGALVGLAVGDAVGTTLEFKAPGTFAPIEDMVGGGPFGLQPGQWTDDTSMAMCLGESILDVGGHDAADQLRRYVDWWRNGYWSSTGRCFDIGNSTVHALSRFERTGAVIDDPIDPDAAANGSLMRLAPVPIRWHGDIELAAEMAAESSRTTHPADRPVDACRVYSAMIAALIQGRKMKCSPRTSGSSVNWTLGLRLSSEVRGGPRSHQKSVEPAMWLMRSKQPYGQ